MTDINPQGAAAESSAAEGNDAAQPDAAQPVAGNGGAGDGGAGDGGAGDGGAGNGGVGNGGKSSAPKPAPNTRNNPTANAVQRTRAWTGLWVVIGGDAAIAAAAVFGLFKTVSSSSAGSPAVAILTSAFTAIGTMTTAYFGIKTMSNTAQSFSPHQSDDSAGDRGK
jgi:hypothetical protein